MPRETVRAHFVVDKAANYLAFFFRFFETESIAVITMMMFKYSVEVKQEPEFIGETFEERFARITSSRQMLTNTYAISSLSCCHGLSFLSDPIACRWYSRGGNYLNLWIFRHFIGHGLLYTSNPGGTMACELRSLSTLTKECSK